MQTTGESLCLSLVTQIIFFIVSSNIESLYPNAWHYRINISIVRLSEKCFNSRLYIQHCDVLPDFSGDVMELRAGCCSCVSNSGGCVMDKNVKLHVSCISTSLTLCQHKKSSRGLKDKLVFASRCCFVCSVL